MNASAVTDVEAILNSKAYSEKRCCYESVVDTHLAVMIDTTIDPAMRVSKS